MRPRYTLRFTLRVYEDGRSWVEIHAPFPEDMKVAEGVLESMGFDGGRLQIPFFASNGDPVWYDVVDRDEERELVLLRRAKVEA